MDTVIASSVSFYQIILDTALLYTYIYSEESGWKWPRKKILSSREIIRRLETAGWILDRVSGSHHVFRHPEKPGSITVPHPRKTMERGTQRAILKAAGLL